MGVTWHEPKYKVIDSDPSFVTTFAALNVRDIASVFAIGAASACVGYFSSVDTATSSNVIGASSNSSVIVGLGKSGAGVGSARVRGVMTVAGAMIGLVGGGCYAFQNAYGRLTGVKAPQ